jgi:long-chain acyl-CoA synthetase
MDEIPVPPADQSATVSGRPEWSGERPWLAHYHEGVPQTVTIPNDSLATLFDQAVSRYGASAVIEYFGATISYAQLGSLVNHFARALLSLGVQHGDRVSLCLANVPQFPIAFFGAMKAGAVIVPTNPLYTEPELEHQLNDAGVKVIVALTQALPNVLAVRTRTSVEHVIAAGPEDYMPLALALAYKVKAARDSFGKPHSDHRALRAEPWFHEFKDMIGHTHDRQGFEVFALPEPAAPEDLAVLQYTGGTTGVAKGAMLTHRNLVANATQVWAWSELGTGTHHKNLCVAPFFHVYGLTAGMNISVINGATMVLLPRFNVAETLKAIEHQKPDLFPGVPAMYQALARAAEKKKADLSSVRICISGSAPLPPEVQAEFERISPSRVVEGYGLTEASPVTHANPVFGDRRSGTIGLPLPNTDAAIRNRETGMFLPVGEQGELAVRGPQVTQGYWKRPDETAKTLVDGWLLTGDIAVMNEDGYFSIVDRAKDMIIVGGLKVFPRQVEDVLYEHPKVLEAGVVGVPDPQRGERVQAFIVLKPGEQATAEELTAFCRERLAPYKIPRVFEFRESLPKTIIGKVLRRQLRDEALAESASAQ